MSEWNETRFSKVATVIMGQSPASEFYNNDGNGLPFMQGNRTFGDRYPTIDTYTTQITKKASKGSILMSVRAPVGEINIAPLEMCIGRGLCAINANDGNNEFVRYLLSYNMPKLKSSENGTTFTAINGDNIKNLKILVPDLPTQKRIAEILSAYDDLIENNNCRIALLEKAAQELYKEWFVRFRFPGYENAKFENGLPEGWGIKKIGDMSKIGSGGDAPKDYSPVRTPEYSVPIFSNGITNDGLYGFAKKGTKKANSITISARGTVGFTCLRFEPYLPIVRLLSIEPDCGVVNVYYLYHNLKNDTIDGYGTSQQQITIPYFSRRRVIVPPVSLQNDFGNIVDKFYIQINQLKAKNENLAQQRDLLLPRLMSGKIDVDNKKQAKVLCPIKLSYDEFLSELGMAARAKKISDADLKAMYEAYLDDETE